MAIDVQSIPDAPGNTIKFVIRNTDDEILDHADNLFESPGTATTPGLAATEKSTFGGVNESIYEADLNLANVNSGLAIAQFFVEAYRQVGGTFSLATALMLDYREIRVANSKLVDGNVGDIAPGYAVKVGFNVTSTLGDYAQLYAWVEFNGVPVIVGGTCVFELFEYDAELANWSHPDGVEPDITQNAIGQFEYLKHLPNLQDDVKYLIRATITVGTAELVGQEALPVIGGA